jgi:NAD(P)-dependent dehydrogenase (short-subunit alcohol dehydrogenase family)
MDTAVRKVCVVTGSSSGIGAATARLYAKNGWNVVVNYSREAPPAERVADECRVAGADALVVKADIALDADCRRLAAEVDVRFGRADVLVNNAGTTKVVAARDLDGLDAAEFHRVYGVNVVGTFQMSRALMPMLLRQPGSAIVHVSSIASMMGTGSSLAYMASKGAINALTIGMARAFGPAVRVNAIAPGLVETPWLQKGLGPERYAAAVKLYKERSALDAVMTPEDIAEAAWWLGVGAAKTTGEVLLLDAGLRLTRG